ncbi:hypothetical protein MSAN_02485200 [Mycena sanguinolenta]|uniref:Uncharacterized protein n=1 Tax=Mycena sanguinolenta TaxID=230812 RepID=A0A8H6U3S7_9AGAR|nr:hypothetical protein MSAN_02485200 [Mycena sanguinolenta]
MRTSFASHTHLLDTGRLPARRRHRHRRRLRRCRRLRLRRRRRRRRRHCLRRCLYHRRRRCTCSNARRCFFRGFPCYLLLVIKITQLFNILVSLKELWCSYPRAFLFDAGKPTGPPHPTHAPQLARPSSSSSPPPPTLAWHSPIQSPEYPHVLPVSPTPVYVVATVAAADYAHHAPLLPRPSSPPMPTLPFPRQFRHGGPEIEGMSPPRRPPLFRRPRSLPTSPPTPTLPCPRRFRRGGPQIHETCLPQYPLPHRCPVLSVPAAVAADFVVSLPIDLGLASNRREVSPTSASASSTPALNVPAAVAADFAIFSSIHLGCFLKPRDVSPAASTTSTTPALVVPATVAVDLAVSSLIHLGCFSNPRGVSPAAPTTSSTPLARRRSRRRRRLSYFVADSAVVGLKLTGRLPTSPSGSSMPAFADYAAVAGDLDSSAVFSPIQPRWASNGRDVYPASASASSTPTLVIPPPPLPTLVRLLKIFSVAADLAQPVESGTPLPLRPELTHRAPSSWPSATCGT